jgi:hypothetical protein
MTTLYALKLIEIIVYDAEEEINNLINSSKNN